MDTGTARAPGSFLRSLAPVVLYTILHLPLPPSQHQLRPHGCPRVLQEHCSHTQVVLHHWCSRARLYCVRHGARP